MYVSQNFKSLDVSYVIKLYVFELINRIELNDFDQCEKQLIQLQKLIAEVKEKDSIKIEISILEIINLFLHKNPKSLEAFKIKHSGIC